ncbi:DNA-binding response regulator [Pseudoprevotella muciniphila]|uniref:DNA-binding response regulator n=1 Tax=Pseudoprevotella muciniphila TaxID=2133944 RepID=A0A5P8E6X4_9BACT|nr:response regulator transcription factor [Pseudoprevotella muciniphila]QFQ12688.1 DNA-binding response regulator [Pseudoprevotella muciniphila]
MTEKKKILVVDDEPDLCEILSFNLAAAGYDTVTAMSAEQAKEILQDAEYQEKGFHLLLLDVMLTGKSGFELAEQLRADEQTKQIPIIFITAKDTEEDTLRGFSLGADDYVAKPFSVREVLARVKAVLNRVQTRKTKESHDVSNLIAYDTLEMHLDTKTLTVDGKIVGLTRTEWDLLLLLLSHQSKVYSRQQILESVWPRDVVVTNRSVDVAIARLRKKIERYGDCIITKSGFGYCFQPTKE